MGGGLDGARVASSEDSDAVAEESLLRWLDPEEFCGGSKTEASGAWEPKWRRRFPRV